jgi:hypothetical protein
MTLKDLYHALLFIEQEVKKSGQDIKLMDIPLGIACCAPESDAVHEVTGLGVTFDGGPGSKMNGIYFLSNTAEDMISKVDNGKLMTMSTDAGLEPVSEVLINHDTKIKH